MSRFELVTTWISPKEVQFHIERDGVMVEESGLYLRAKEGHGILTKADIKATQKKMRYVMKGMANNK